MISIVEYLEANKKMHEDFLETMNEIELDMVFESFSCKILQEIRSQLKEIREDIKARKKEIDATEYEQPWMKPSLPRPPQDFKGMFIYNSIQWDKITDDQVHEFSKDDQAGIKLVKRICSNRSNSIPGVVILKSSDEKYKFSGLIIKDSWNIKYHSLIGNTYKDNVEVKPSEAVDYLTDPFWVIEIQESQLSHQIKNDRRSARSGMIKMGDPDEYLKIAKANMERYKRLAEKKRIEQNADDGVYDKVMDYVQKVMNVAEMFSKDPIKYAQHEYKIQSLLDMLGDRQRYDSGTRKSNGENGLLYLFNTYLSYKLQLAKGTSYDYTKESFNRAKKGINELFKKIDKKIYEINKDLN